MSEPGDADIADQKMILSVMPQKTFQVIQARGCKALRAILERKMSHG